MKRVIVLVEGQTEELFVNTMLGPHLLGFEVHLAATVLCTKGVAGRRQFRGGCVSFKRVNADVKRLLGSKPDLVTTMFDLYGLKDFPIPEKPTTNPIELAKCLEHALERDIDHAGFKAFLMVHEFEALLFSEPAVLAQSVPGASPDAALFLAVQLAGIASPEHINHDDPPSHRISHVLPAFKKKIDGIQTAQAIRLPRLREACKHFDEWLTLLESVGQTV